MTQASILEKFYQKHGEDFHQIISAPSEEQRRRLLREYSENLVLFAVQDDEY